MYVYEYMYVYVCMILYACTAFHMCMYTAHDMGVHMHMHVPI